MTVSCVAGGVGWVASAAASEKETPERTVDAVRVVRTVGLLPRLLLEVDRDGPLRVSRSSLPRFTVGGGSWENRHFVRVQVPAAKSRQASVLLVVCGRAFVVGRRWLLLVLLLLFCNLARAAATRLTSSSERPPPPPTVGDSHVSSTTGELWRTVRPGRERNLRREQRVRARRCLARA